MALGLAVGTPAWAEPPVVNVVPFTSTRAGEGENSLLDSQLPASREFLFRQPMAKDVDEASAELLIWPEAESAQGCAQPPEREASQFYMLGMVPRGSADARYLEAKVPALQVGQRFCFQVTPQQAMSSGQLQAITEAVSTALLTRLQGGAPCFDGSSLPAFREALAGAIKEQELTTGDVTPAAQLALNRYVVNETDQCERFSVAFFQRTKVEQLVAAETRVRQLEGGLAGLPTNLPPLRSPLVMTASGQVLPAAELLVVGTPDQTLQDAANQLLGRGMGAAWADALVQLGQAAPERKQETVAALRKPLQDGSLPAPPTFELWDGKAFVPPAEFVKAHTEDAERLARGVIERLPAGPEREAWLKALGTLVTARENLRLARTSYQSRQDEFTRAEAHLRTVLTGALSADDVRKQLRIHIRPVRVIPTAGSGETPTKANYASVDLGVAFAFTDFDTWFLPYVGLNLYAAPVDRTIAPSQLTGSAAHKYLWQRLSLTLGVSLSAPTTPGRTVGAPLLGRYPLAALGYRVGSYSRVVGGVVFYQLADPNPLSASKSLKGSPFVGASLDVDLVHLLTEAL